MPHNLLRILREAYIRPACGLLQHALTDPADQPRLRIRARGDALLNLHARLLVDRGARERGRSVCVLRQELDAAFAAYEDVGVFEDVVRVRLARLLPVGGCMYRVSP